MIGRLMRPGCMYREEGHTLISWPDFWWSGPGARAEIVTPYAETGPVAQLVGRCITYGESTSPGYKSPRFEVRRVFHVYDPPDGYGFFPAYLRLDISKTKQARGKQ